MYETYYKKLQPYFGAKNIQLHYMHTDSFVLGLNTNKIIKDLERLENLFGFNILKKFVELFNNRIKKIKW